MKDIAEILQENELFRDFSLRELEQYIIPRGHCRSFARGQQLIYPRMQVTRLGILLSGKVALQRIFSGGGYSLLAKLAPGELLGVDLVCTRSQLAPYHAIAVQSTEVFFLDIAALTQPGLLPETLRLKAQSRLLMILSQENVKKEYRIAILSQHGLRERVLAYLTMQHSRLQCNPFLVSLNREEMAAYLCVNRSALSHELSLMRREGLIDFHRNRFCLLVDSGEETSSLLPKM